MSDASWQELGIARTRDEGALRRAYADRLRAINVEGDPAAFMRLREAYEEALREIAAGAEASLDAGAAVAAPDDPLVIFRTAFRQALDAGDVRRASGALKSALAQGIVPVGLESALVASVLDGALADDTLSGEELEDLQRLVDSADLPRDAGRALALRLLRQRAAAGDAEDQYALGSLYARGEGGVPEDAAEAVVWLRLAAQRGHEAAQTYLGFMYEYGRGVPVDSAEAAKWYRAAAESGEPTAQSNLAEMHLYGRGVPRDAAEAEKWYLRAADQGHASAQYKLAHMYLYGEGVERDHVAAYGWLKLALANGAGDLDWMAERLTAAELAAAKDWLRARAVR